MTAPRAQAASNITLADETAAYPRLMRVWILWHIPPGGAERGEYGLMGVYSSREAALEAVDRLKDKPGFRDHPEVNDDADDAGFFMSQYELDQDHWTEGFRTELA